MAQNVKDGQIEFSFQLKVSNSSRKSETFLKLKCNQQKTVRSKVITLSGFTKE